MPTKRSVTVPVKFLLNETQNLKYLQINAMARKLFR